MRHAITNALILAALLSPLRAGAVVGTDVVGIGTVPEQVTVSFPNGTAQNVDPTTPGGPVLIVPDGSLPGGFRVIVNGASFLKDADVPEALEVRLGSGRLKKNC